MTTVADISALVSPDEHRHMLARLGGIDVDRFLEALYKDIRRSISHLEANKRHHANAGEDAITAQIVGNLKIGGYNASSETSTNGHVDVTVESTRLEFKWLGEAKLWDGCAYIEEGMKQLVTRYTTGKDSAGGIFIYIRCAREADMVQKWRDHVEKYAVCDLLNTPTPLDQRFQFSSTHTHPSGTRLQVQHFSAFLHAAPADKSARQSKKSAKKTQS